MTPLNCCYGPLLALRGSFIFLTVTAVRDIHGSIRAVLKLRTGEVTSPLPGGMAGSHDGKVVGS